MVVASILGNTIERMSCDQTTVCDWSSLWQLYFSAKSFTQSSSCSIYLLPKPDIKKKKEKGLFTASTLGNGRMNVAVYLTQCPDTQTHEDVRILGGWKCFM